LRDLHKEEENSATDMAKVTSAMRALRTVLGCAILFVHHMGKSGPDSKNRSDGGKLRGSSVIHGAVDGLLTLTDLKGDASTNWDNACKVVVKGARSADPFRLSLSVTDDDHGEATTATWGCDGSQAEARREAEEAKAAADVGAVVDVLRAAYERDSLDDVVSRRAIMRAARMGHPAMERALAEARAQGLIEEHGAGWRVVAPR
jgi:hypothetical protein